MADRLLKILSVLALAAIYTFLLAPIIVIVFASFNPTQSLAFPPSGFSLRWYQEFLNMPVFVKAFQNSILVAIATAIIATVLAVPAAYAIVRYRFRGRDLTQSFLLAPTFVPSIIVGVALLNFFSNLALRGTLLAMLAGHVLLSVPYVLRTVTASLTGIDLTVEEAAMMLGTNPIVTFFKVTLPLMTSGIFAGVLFVFVTSFGELNASLFISGPNTVTLPIQIFSHLQWNSSPVIAAVSTTQIAMILGASLMIEKIFGLGKAMEF
jgi:putative spermidine/putrescine transport system permease protein